MSKTSFSTVNASIGKSGTDFTNGWEPCTMKEGKFCKENEVSGAESKTVFSRVWSWPHHLTTSPITHQRSNCQTGHDDSDAHEDPSIIIIQDKKTTARGGTTFKGFRPLTSYIPSSSSRDRFSLDTLHLISESRWRINCIRFENNFLYQSKTTQTTHVTTHLSGDEGRLIYYRLLKSLYLSFHQPSQWQQYLLKNFLPTNPLKANLSSTSSRWSAHFLS